MHLSTSIILALALTAGQTVADVRQLYDAGKYREVVGALDQATVEADKASRLQYLAAQSYDKLNDAEAARRTYQRLADISGEAPWASIGRSAVQLMDKQFDEALGSADQAVRLAASLPEAHYQRGVVLMARKEYGDAVDGFTKAVQLDPAFAAAHYYAGLANYRVKRIDLMTNHFETFIKLAPNAPERPEVESILRTVRGR
jgi:tetratricopeptide (TPR) repeat protein